MFGSDDAAAMRRPGALTRHWRQGQTLFAAYGESIVSVTALTDAIVRIRLAPHGSFAPRRSWAIPPPDESFAPVPIAVEQDAEGVRIDTEQLVVVLAQQAGRMAIRDRLTDRVIVADGPAGGSAWDPRDGSAAWIKQMPQETRYYCPRPGLGRRTGRAGL